MPTKITLTLEQESKQRSAAAMAKAMQMLSDLHDTPPQKLAVTLICEDEDAATIKEELEEHFSRRPAGIKVTIKTASEQEIAVTELIPLTPMDEVWQEPTGSDRMPSLARR